MIILQMAVGAFVFSAILSFFLAYKNYERELNVYFFLISLSIVINTCVLYVEYYTHDLQAWILLEKIESANLLCFTATVSFFLQLLTRVRFKKWFYASLGLLSVFFIINLVSPYGVALSFIGKHPNGDGSNGFETFVTRSSVWFIPLVLFSIFYLVYIVKIIIRYYRRGKKENAILLVMVFVPAVIATSVMLAGYHLLVSKFLSESCFLLFILIVFKWNFESIIKSGQIKADLVASEKRYRQLFENAPIGIYHASPDGKFLMANPCPCQNARL
ncbi:MAG: hypothetical protein WCJ01_04935 [Ignavibacteria bacterium]